MAAQLADVILGHLNLAANLFEVILVVLRCMRLVLSYSFHATDSVIVVSVSDTGMEHHVCLTLIWLRHFNCSAHGWELLRKLRVLVSLASPIRMSGV